MTTQYYQLTLSKAIAKYEAGLMSSVGLLFDYLCITYKPGWKIDIDPQKICDKLKLTKDQFYRGLRKIKKCFPQFKINIINSPRLTGYIESEENPTTAYSTTADAESAPPSAETTTANVKTTTANAESATPAAETATTNVKTATANAETATKNREKPNKINADRDLPNSSPDYYQSFSNSLSDSSPDSQTKSKPITKPTPQRERISVNEDGNKEVITKAKPSRDSYANFWGNLPQSDRDKFLDFVREKTKHFANPIVHIHDYLANKNRWQEFYKNFRLVTQLESEKARDWTTHPDWEKALEAMRSPKVGKFMFSGFGVDEFRHLPKEVRKAMRAFAEENNYIE
ncbi:MAG: hypothetical protein QNJ54_29205 [Prochloraceae cyanobacterium]|nr:hypothetical protein [Prochloraceae cyanobacterium]